MPEKYEAAVDFVKTNWIFIVPVVLLVLVFVAGRALGGKTAVESP